LSDGNGKIPALGLPLAEIKIEEEHA